MSLYEPALATYDSSSTFDQSWSNGFIQIWAMPTVVANARKRQQQTRILVEPAESKDARIA